MQAMPDVRVATMHRNGLPGDLSRVIDSADPADVVRMFEQLEGILRASSNDVPAVAVTLSDGVVGRQIDRSSATSVTVTPQRRHRALDALTFVGLRAVLPIGILVAGLFGVMALVG